MVRYFWSNTAKNEIRRTFESHGGLIKCEAQFFKKEERINKIHHKQMTTFISIVSNNDRDVKVKIVPYYICSLLSSY